MSVFVITKTSVFFRSKGELNLAGFFLQVIKLLFVKTSEQIQNQTGQKRAGGGGRHGCGNPAETLGSTYGVQSSDCSQTEDSEGGTPRIPRDQNGFILPRQGKTPGPLVCAADFRMEQKIIGVGSERYEYAIG